MEAGGQQISLRYRMQLRDIVSAVVRGRMNRKQAVAEIASWARDRIDPAEQQRFIEIAEAGLTSLHEGNFARFQIKPSEFAAWQRLWEEP